MPVGLLVGAGLPLNVARTERVTEHGDLFCERQHRMCHGSTCACLSAAAGVARDRSELLKQLVRAGQVLPHSFGSHVLVLSVWDLVGCFLARLVRLVILVRENLAVLV